MQNTGTAKSYGFFPTSGVYAVSDPNLSSPQINTWNLSIQRQVGKWLLSGSYLGNHTAHLWSSRELNPQIYIPGNCAAGQYGLTAPGPCSSTSANNTAARRKLTLANPTWGPWYSTIAYLDAGATSSYNGMILSAQHRMANNFSVLANWTYSHCLADPSTTELTGPSYVDPNNRSADRSNCSSDHRQQVNISGVLTSPNVHQPVAGLLANGWQAAPIFHWSTGNLTTVDLRHGRCADRRRQPAGAADSVERLTPTEHHQLPEHQRVPGPARRPGGVYATTRPLHRLRSERDEHRPGVLAELQDSGAQHDAVPRRGLQPYEQRHVRTADRRPEQRELRTHLAADPKQRARQHIDGAYHAVRDQVRVLAHGILKLMRITSLRSSSAPLLPGPHLPKPIGRPSATTWQARATRR